MTTVRSVRVEPRQDPVDRLWVLDTGSPMFQRTEHGGPKLIHIGAHPVLLR
jgi:hypothetical protein